MTQYKTIADLPAASSINPQDLLELSQFGTSRCVSLHQLGGGAVGVPEAPVDGQQYARQSAAWTVVAPAGGTVISTSVVSANGLAGTVATPTTTPAITLSTTVTGVLKGNGLAISAAVAGTDYVIPGGLPTSLPPSGTASGDLAGTYPSPTIKPSVGLTGVPVAPTAVPSTTNTTQIATTAFVQSALSGVSVTIPAGTIAFGGAGGVLTGNSTLAWDNTNKAFGVSGWTGAVAAFSVAGSVPATPPVDAFIMSIANPSNAQGNIFRLRSGAAGTTDQFKVDMYGDAACSGSLQAFALSAPPAGGGGAFGIFLGNFSGGNSGVYFGSGAPTLSTFGRYGSLYINTASPGVPSYNSDGGTGWTLLAPITAVGTSPPAAPVSGQLWFNNDASTGGGVLYIYYSDPNTSQWVAVSPPTSGPPVSLLEARVAELEARLAALVA